MNVSVIIAVYNGAAYLDEAIQSVLSQSHPPNEVIVVDDGSTDNTPAIIASFKPFVTALRQINQGTAAAVDSGIKHASGDYIAFLDADDVWLPRKLEQQTRVFTENPQVDAVFGYMQQFISPDLDEHTLQRFDCPDAPEPAWSKGTALIRRQIFEQVGLFDSKWRMGEFIDWYLRAQEAGARMVMLDEVMMHRRWHTGNLTAKAAPQQLVDYARIVQAARLRRKASGYDEQHS